MWTRREFLETSLKTGGAFGAGAGAPLLAGALGFFVSDLAVARERFVAKSFSNKLWGLPLYYAAQLVLAGTVSGR